MKCKDVTKEAYKRKTNDLTKVCNKEATRYLTKESYNDTTKGCKKIVLQNGNIGDNKSIRRERQSI